MNTIEVTVDKNHIVTIGERLYGESVELIRELVNNAYDVDATEVKVTITDDSIVVEDDGSGMDLDGLKQYFNIGSTLKKNTPKSPKFASDRTGFIKDTPQYTKFLEVMERVIERIKPVLDELSDYKENKRARRTLTEVLERVKNALILNPDFCPEGLIPIAEGTSDVGEAGYISQTKQKVSAVNKEQGAEAEQKKIRKRKPAVKQLTPTAVIKKLKLG